MTMMAKMNCRARRMGWRTLFSVMEGDMMYVDFVVEMEKS